MVFGSRRSCMPCPAIDCWRAVMVLWLHVSRGPVFWAVVSVGPAGRVHRHRSTIRREAFSLAMALRAANETRRAAGGLISQRRESKKSILRRFLGQLNTFGN